MIEEKTKQEEHNHVKKISNKLQQNSEELRIKRVPTATMNAFKELANAEFCGDCGFLLKWLMDDIISVDSKMIIAKLNEHDQRLTSLEQTINNTQPTEDDSTKRMVNGKLIRVKK